ncbi:hypothetical protein SARC_14170, partial [Sphaeroforma arctica JP610]
MSCSQPHARGSQASGSRCDLCELRLAIQSYSLTGSSNAKAPRLQSPSLPYCQSHRGPSPRAPVAQAPGASDQQ